MKSRTKISWADFTMNPWEGCTKVSAGCKHCYAEARNNRYADGANWGKGAPRRKSNHTVNDLATINRRFGPTGDLRLLEHDRHYERWIDGREDWPTDLLPTDSYTVVKPQVFSLSLGDILDPEIPAEWLAEWLTAIAAAPNLEFLLLTKRPELFWKRMEMALATTNGNQEAATAVTSAAAGLLPNVAWGTSVEDETNAPRVLGLAAIPAARRFLSCEPLIGDPQLWKMLVMIDKGAINLVISGGESGAQARPMHPGWVDSIQKDCEDHGIPHHFKQWGTWAPAELAAPQDANQDNPGNRIVLNRDGTMTTKPNDHGWQEMVRTASKTAVKPMIAGRIQQPRLVFP